MGASASQIASAKALAKSRGYDPSTVDADNADRANTAFPTKGATGPAAPQQATSTPSSSPVVAGIQTAAQGISATPTAVAPTNPDPAAIGPGTALGSGEAEALPMQAMLRQGLGRRIPPVNSMALAGIRNVIY